MVLRVVLQVVPFGDEEKAREIGRLDIFNMGQAEFGHSEYGVLNLTNTQTGKYVDTVLHRRSSGAWALVKKAIISLGIEGP